MNNIPLLDNKAFLRRFGQPGLSRNAIDYNQFELVRFEHVPQVLAHPLPLPFMRSTNHDFVFLTKGSITRNRGADLYTISEHQLFFIPAFQITRAVSMSKTMEGFYVNFTEDFLMEHTGKKAPLDGLPVWMAEAPPLWSLPANLTPVFSENLRKIETFLTGNHPQRASLTAWHLFAFFQEIKPFLTPNTSDTIGQQGGASVLANRFKTLLQRGFDPHKSLANYAQECNVSPNHLNKCVRHVFGKTCTELIDEYRLLEIRVLLLQREWSLSSIADQLGFSDLTHFGRFFKRKTGQTASAFRKKMGGNE